ncbi:MAG: U32 family peptidase, partial [Oscillospiraceae bacterium]
AEIVKSVAPSLARHGSTQMAVHTLEGAKLLGQLGYTRVILARELSLEQVEYITANCGIETEVFVHGALCVCLSGQCYASAFLGGRSGNRGRCAGTCRLPMSARADMEDNHLSLKDLCALDMLPQLKAMGVKSVKIEGRMRTPEYVAGAVDACVKAANGESYDKQILADTFSRSGFTNGFLEGKIDKNVFGVRTKEESKKTKETLPQLRQLYRREGQYVPVEWVFKMSNDSSVLSITDGKNTFEKVINEAVCDSKGDFEKSLKAALEKLGGTPFFAKNINTELIEGKYLPLSLVNEGRRALTDKLLKARSTINEYRIFDLQLPQCEPRVQTPKLIARFENVRQIPVEYCEKFEYIIVPIECFTLVPESIKEKIVLELPRDMLGGTEKLKEQIADAMFADFDKFCVQNIGQLPLVKGETVFSSFTLNVSNSLAAKKYAQLGV